MIDFQRVHKIDHHVASFITLGSITVLMLYSVIRQRDEAYQLLEAERIRS